jgi:hypothetical protein
VSISTASLVNHQSQFRVPPMPRMASRPWPVRSASGKSTPEFISAVVLPAPGGPIRMYHGNSYSQRRPPFWPRRVFFSTPSASVSRPRMVSISSSAASPGAVPCCAMSSTSRALALRLRTIDQATAKAQITSSAAIAATRTSSLSSGRASAKAKSGPTNHRMAASNSTPIRVTNQRAVRMERILRIGSRRSLGVSRPSA